MRLWSLHPKYLDTKGLVALWREALLAQHVLEGKTKGYKNHPQLNRFKSSKKPMDAINQYLSEIYAEASNRGFNFTRNKINWDFNPLSISVTEGQMDYEVKHLQNKLKIRNAGKYLQLSELKTFDHHPLFDVVEGKIEAWEIFI